MSVSYSALSPADKAQVLRNLALRRRRYEANVLRFNPARGCLCPGAVVLVGDRLSPQASPSNRRHQTPFYSLKHSSGWLNALLLKEQIPEEALLWLNAYAPDGTPTAPSALFNLRPGAVIALGRQAARWLRVTCGVTSFLETHHPQYWKRFHHGEPYPLIPLLKGLIA